MIVIADCGGSKTEWRVISSKGELSQRVSRGFNPNVLPPEYFSTEVLDPAWPEPVTGAAHVYFYGAALTEPAFIENVRLSLQSRFTNAKIDVGHDLLGASRALCQREEGLVCILGTGANSCYYDGNRIADTVRSTGYLLGDEGSGAWLGKELAAAYIREELPEPLYQKFEQRTGKNPLSLRTAIYTSQKPNEYLASFARFAVHHQQDPYVYQLIQRGFQLFFEKNIFRYARHKELPMHCCGGIAFYLGNLLRESAQHAGLQLNRIIETPIAGLTLYHQES